MIRNKRIEKKDRAYSIYGLTVRSAVLLPELVETPFFENIEADVKISWGRVLADHAKLTQLTSYLWFDSFRILLEIPDVAKFEILNGSVIRIQKAARASDADVRAFLYGIVFGALLHQRRLLPLHVSAVLTPRGVVAFTGPSGAGKSTLATLINRITAWPLISDDVAVVRYEAGTPQVLSGLNRLKLWKDAVDFLNLDASQLTKDYSRMEKFHFNSAGCFADINADLTAVVLLEHGATTVFSQHSGANKLKVLMSAVHMPEFGPIRGSTKDILRQCIELSSHVDTYLFSSPKPQAINDDRAKFIIDAFE